MLGVYRHGDSAMLGNDALQSTAPLIDPPATPSVPTTPGPRGLGGPLWLLAGVLVIEPPHPAIAKTP
jgi:hypothetical protein